MSNPFSTCQKSKTPRFSLSQSSFPLHSVQAVPQAHVRSTAHVTSLSGQGKSIKSSLRPSEKLSCRPKDKKCPAAPAKRKCSPQPTRGRLTCSSKILTTDGCHTQFGQLADRSAVPCEADLLFCNAGGALSHAPIIQRSSASCDAELLFCGPSGLERAPILARNSVLCDRELLVCGPSGLERAPIIDDIAVPCDAQLLYCNGSEIVTGQLGLADAVPCDAGLVFCTLGASGTLALGAIRGASGVPCAGPQRAAELVFCGATGILFRGPVPDRHTDTDISINQVFKPLFDPTGNLPNPSPLAICAFNSGDLELNSYHRSPYGQNGAQIDCSAVRFLMADKTTGNGYGGSIDQLTYDAVPCGADIVFCDSSNLMASAPIIDTNAPLPDNASVVFCGPTGLARGFLTFQSYPISYRLETSANYLTSTTVTTHTILFTSAQTGNPTITAVTDESMGNWTAASGVYTVNVGPGLYEVILSATYRGPTTVASQVGLEILKGASIIASTFDDRLLAASNDTTSTSALVRMSVSDTLTTQVRLGATAVAQVVLILNVSLTIRRFSL